MRKDIYVIASKIFLALFCLHILINKDKVHSIINSFKPIFAECLLWTRPCTGDLQCIDEQDKVLSLTSSHPGKGSKMWTDSVMVLWAKWHGRHKYLQRSETFSMGNVEKIIHRQDSILVYVHCLKLGKR